jgi:hypothetical protein
MASNLGYRRPLPMGIRTTLQDEKDRHNHGARFTEGYSKEMTSREKGAKYLMWAALVIAFWAICTFCGCEHFGQTIRDPLLYLSHGVANESFATRRMAQV